MKLRNILILSLVLLLSSHVIATPLNQTHQLSEDNQIINFVDEINKTSIDHSFQQDLTRTDETQLKYKNQSFIITPKEIVLQQITNKNSISLENATVFNQPGLPLVPMKTVTITLPKNATIHHIEVTDYILQKSTQPITFQQTPLPHFWSINETPLQQHADEIIENTITEAKQNLMYPGTTHSSIIGENSTHTKAIIHLFPIQYQFDTKETYLINQGNICISYVTKQEETAITTDPVENIIITHPSFSTQAEKLKQFHNDQGIQTEVVTTNWIKSNFEPSAYPPVRGYKDFSRKDRIQKYDDELALKIISYLQHQSTNPQLKYVTLLGNAIHVPPSYYFGYNYYPVPTDFYYSSPDLDLIPNYRIGRLPVHTILEATRTVNKIINWNPSETQMDNIAIAGGIPFNSPFFIGELITVDSVNRGFFDGLNVDKYYRTNERFESSDIISALQNEYGLLYMICHGNANVIVAEEGRISARTVGNMPKNNNAPIFSCIGCSSGSYDTHVIKQGYSLDRTSIGESIVISKGGGIAYIGGSRTNDGFPLLTLNKGRVEISKETYMAGLLTYVNQAYKNNVDNLGDLTFYGSETYLENNEMTDFWNQYHYFDFILLGDPALQLPKRTFVHDTYQQPITTAIDAVDSIVFTEEYNGTISLLAIDETHHYQSLTDSPFVTLKEIETGIYQNIEIITSTHATQNNGATIEIPTSAGSIKLLRFETNDGKEDWMYYKPACPVNCTYDSQTTGFGITRWNSIQQAIDNAASEDLIFVFKGLYNETIEIDHPCNIEGEDKHQTIIEGTGYDDVITISSNGVILKGFTIQHCGKNPWNAGISIHPKTSLKPLPIIIDNNIVTNNKNCGFYIDINQKLLCPKLTISNNEISYNNYGIYVQKGTGEKEITQNSISGNNYGLYMLNSNKNTIFANHILNNYVGLYMKETKKTDIISNNFIDNSQHCQFSEKRFTSFNRNYWDNWIGNLFNGLLPIPKIINGFHNQEQTLLSQFGIDFHPLKEPVLV